LHIALHVDLKLKMTEYYLLVAQIFAVLFIVSLIGLLIYYIFLLRLAFYKSTSSVTAQPPVSIIICAKNEEENLFNFLPKIFMQDYPSFEVIVVNDFSEDGTEDILKAFQAKYTNLHVVHIKQENVTYIGKKYPLTLGIKAAKNEHMLFIDADCYPNSDKWLKEMMKAYTPKKDIVLGYGGYQKNKSFLNKFIRFDTLNVAIQYLSHAVMGIPYMGVGRNLSYTKTIFYKYKGFTTHHHIISGDDDLFVNKAAETKNTALQISKEAFTYSVPKATYHQFITQKVRHTTTGKFYKFRDKFLLTFFYSAKLLFVVSFPVLIVIEYKINHVLGAVGLVWLLHMLIYGKICQRFNEKDLIVWSTLFELYALFFYPYLAIKSLKTRMYLWK
jgi:glycosyltransferase involved in cell wall biosynthesis